MLTRVQFRVFGFTAALITGAAAMAAEPAALVRPEAPAIRIDVAEAPVIDGDLGDAVWDRATVIEEFRQIDPDSGMPGTERTVLRILYDEDNLYFAAYCYDSGPVTLSTRARDGDLATGDLVRIYLDPGQTRRNAYSFEVGSSGARRDALIQNNTAFLGQWDTLWRASARIVDDGWTVEIAIPFRSISYDRNQPDWGFDFTRAIRRLEQRVRWTSYSAAIDAIDVSQSGTLTGIASLREGLGIDVQVYGRATYKQDWDVDRNALSGAAGGNAYYRITPGLTGTLTVNPDFSDTPLDARQINLSRFSLFVPETRDFFLQDAAAFEFGGRNFLSPNARPFFSRNFGLIEGEPVTILGGAKLSGSYEDVAIGALSVRANEKGDTDSQTLSAARVSAPVLSESRIGAIVTHGDPTGLTENSVAGADFQYRDSLLFGDKILQADLYYERSFSDSAGEDDSFGLAVNYPNEPWSAFLRLREVGQDFAPALGFVNQPGIRVYGIDVNRTARSPMEFLRIVRVGVNEQLITGLDDRMHSWNNGGFVALFSENGDTVQVDLRNLHERVPEDFTLPGDVTVPPARYQWSNVIARLSTSRARSISGDFIVECCSFYDGSFLRSEAALLVRPYDAVEIASRYIITVISLPGGEVTIHVPTVDAAVNFTPDMQLALQGQFDNISERFGFSARYRWEYALGNELFAAVAQSALIPGMSFDPQTTQTSLRLGHTLRF